MKRLIVNADDFGLTPGVNRAILAAHTRGIVTSATLMANMPAFAEAVALAQQHPTLGVGLHFNLTQGRPVAAPQRVPSLLNAQGEFLGTSTKLAQRSWRGQLNAADIETELRAQLERLQAAGIKITHVDSHKHAHALPVVLRVLRQTLPAYGVRALRLPHEVVDWRTALTSAQQSKQALTATGLRWLCARTARHLHAAQLRTPDAFFGVTQTGFWSKDWLKQLFAQLPEGVSELMCHPGYADADLQGAQTRLQASRETELRCLTDPELRAVLAAQNVELVHFGQL